jgi:hypothetical protein
LPYTAYLLNETDFSYHRTILKTIGKIHDSAKCREATRTGKAGTGVAIMADKVRKPDMRSADAIKNTSYMKKSTLQNHNGYGLIKPLHERESVDSRGG